MRSRSTRLLALLLLLLTATTSAATLSVGPGKPYARPSQAIAAAQAGDIIEIDAASNYDGDVCYWTTNRLRIHGVGGRARIDAAGQNSQGKAIWVVGGNDNVIENIDLSGARVPDQNGAGIRFEGRGLTLRNCHIHDNETGILAGDVPGSEVLIEYSEFENNASRDGGTSNISINGGLRFTLRFCYVHHARREGQNVRSGALENYIEYNRIMDETDGSSDYLIYLLPTGGATYLIGNLLQQGALSENSGMVIYAAEGTTNPRTNLFVVNNTFVNDKGTGIFIDMLDVMTPAVLRNNIFFGGGTVITQPDVVRGLRDNGNWLDSDPMLVDRATYDYRLQPGSPCVDHGVDPGTGLGIPLAPLFEYVHPLRSEPRATRGPAIDIGAYELGVDGGRGVGGMDGRLSLTPGAAQGLTLLPTARDIVYGECTEGRLVLRNTGTGPLSVSVESLRNPFTVAEGDGEFVLQPGESRNVTVHFCPPAGSLPRSYTTTLGITSTDPAALHVNVPVRVVPL